MSVPIITARGIGVVVSAILILLLANLTRVGWLFLLDSLLWGTVVVSSISPWLASGRLRVRRHAGGWATEPGPMEGAPVELRFTVENRGLLPSAFVTVAYGIASPLREVRRGRMFIAWLGRGRSTSGSAEVIFKRRGLHRMPAATSETKLPFGLFRKRSRAGEAADILVYPRMFAVSRLALLGRAGETSFRPQAARLGEQIVGSRRYVPGDPVRHIHWRNTARLGQPQVKEFEQTPQSSLMIALDPAAIRRDGEDALEHAVRLAASVGDHVYSLGGSADLVAGRLRLEQPSRDQFLEQLALLEPSETQSSPMVIEPGPYSSVLGVVSDGGEGAADALLDAVTGHRVVTAVVLTGFSAPPRGDLADRLRQAGVVVVDCGPDGIPAALAALEGPVAGRAPQTATAVVR